MMDKKKGNILKFRSHIIIFFAVLLAGCLSKTNVSVSSQTNEPLVTPTNDNILEYQCLEVGQKLPFSEQPQGIWVLDNHSRNKGYVKFLNLVTGEERLLIKDDDNNWRSNFYISPGGKWLAYRKFILSSEETWLIVEDVKGQSQKQFKIEINWYLGGWLDNEHLWLDFNNSGNPTEEYVIVYSIAGDKQILLSNYPDIAPMVNPSSFFFYFTNFIYHPSLDMVVYPQEIYLGDLKYDYSIVLWDRQAEKVVAKVNEASPGSTHAVLWSQDGKYLFVTAQLRDPEDLTSINGELDEWFEIGIDGQVRQLTQFGDLFPIVNIGDGASLSPDGRYLAFWLGHQESQCCTVRQLTILDTETLRSINYCISTSESYPPIWSGDGKYLAVQNQTNNDHYQAVLVDIEDGWAAKIGDDLIPIGWMAEP